ncbi:MAG: aminoacyl-tRNA hydrolase [Candidatus Gracilibacteria bacterium]|nr:aminoacyl-tRNA hydrolase [Candidatus Gracilibacteria bacterium]
MKLIVGLGNPGKQYEETRHNVGFRVLDLLRDKLVTSEWKFEPRYKAEVSEGQDFLLVKPQTFMNLSGQAVWPLKKFYKISNEDLLVIYDDMAFPVGTLKIRKEGNAGGHNGIKSLIESLGTNVFSRIRIGIGEPTEEGREHVLGKFSTKEKKEIAKVLTKAVNAVEAYLGLGILDAMNRFN